MGLSKILCGDVEKPLDYQSVKYTLNGFADVTLYTPNDCDLLDLLTDCGKKRKGWWTGQSYWGIRLLPGEKVIAWKKCKELC